jgi:hypothetical protein
MKKLILTAVSIVSLALALSADVYLKTRLTTDPITAYGQSIPAKQLYTEQWISDDYYLNSSEGLTYLLDIRKNVFYIIGHTTKSYIETKFPVDFATLLPQEMTQMARALQQMTISVRSTGETKILNNIRCQEYWLEMTVMLYPVEMTVWASEELPVNLKNFLEKIQPEILKLQLRASGQAASEIQKIKGLWIAYEGKAEVMGMEVKSRAEVVELSKKPAPAGLYNLPSGYKKKARLEMEDIQWF